MKKLLLLSCLILALVGAYTWRYLKVTTDLEYFLPQGSGESRIASDVLRALSQSTLSRRLVFVVSGEQEADVLVAAKALELELKKLPLRVTENAAAGEALFKALFRHRYHFISNRPEQELPALLSEKGLNTAVAELKAALASPAGALVRRGAVEDPLLLARRPLTRISELNTAGLQMAEGVLLTESRKQAVLFALSDAKAFDGSAQAELWSELDAAFGRVRARVSGKVVVEASALSRYAVAAEKSMRADMLRVSVVSTIAIVVVLWWVFVRWRTLPLLLLPLLAGFLVGTFACLLAFGSIHVMTFAFGSSLIGVCVDYPIYLVNHSVLAGQQGSHARKPVFVALCMGAATTAFGLAALGWGGLPGLKEIAVFGAFGVAAALSATLLWLPHLVESEAPVPPRQQRAANAVGRALAWLLSERRVSYLLFGAAAAVCAVGLPRVRWEDDPQKLTVVDPRVEAEDARVRQAALGEEGGELVVLLSDKSEQASLIANDQLAATLGDAVRAGELAGFASLHNVIWSEDLQRRNSAWVTAHLPVASILKALDNEEFDSSAFVPFGENTRDLVLPPLRLVDLPKPVYDAFVAPWFVPLPDGRRGLLTRLTDVKDPAALRARLASLPNARYLNVKQFRVDAYSLFRSRMLLLLGIGLGVVGCALLAYYRRWRPTLAAFGPAVLAALTATAILSLTGQTLNLMHVMGLLLVLSMGADYGIFLVEGLKNRSALGPPALSIALACASTVLSFGLLALSDSPALRAVGQMIGLGVVLSMLLAAPLAALLLPSPASRDDRLPRRNSSVEP